MSFPPVSLAASPLISTWVWTEASLPDRQNYVDRWRVLLPGSSSRPFYSKRPLPWVCVFDDSAVFSAAALGVSGGRRHKAAGFRWTLWRELLSGALAKPHLYHLVEMTSWNRQDDNLTDLKLQTVFTDVNQGASGSRDGHDSVKPSSNLARACWSCALLPNTDVKCTCLYVPTCWPLMTIVHISGVGF